MWLSVCSDVQIVCHCRPETPSSLASFKSRVVLPFWYRLTQVVLEKRPTYGCSSSPSMISVLDIASVVVLEVPLDQFWAVLFLFLAVAVLVFASLFCHVSV